MISPPDTDSIAKAVELIREVILSQGKETLSAAQARRDYQITREKWDRYINEGYITPLYKPYCKRPVYAAAELRALLSPQIWPETLEDEGPPGSVPNETGSCSSPPQPQITIHNPKREREK